MINTNKKIHIYNRFRTIYTSKNRYYIRHNKKYIDIYAIIKNANHNSIQPSRQRGGAVKNENTFLLTELNAIKNSIVIFKLLIDDKQSEAINIYINLIELINSKRELIINKINTYPLNHFDNELNKAAIITYVKNMLYNNIFNNYLINIIPRIDIYDNIKEANKEYNTDVFEYIIKSLLHFDDKGDKEVLEGIMKKIEKYKDVLKKSIIDNCVNHTKLKNMIGKSIEVAKQKVEEAKNEPEEEDETAVEEADATGAGATNGTGATTGTGADAGAATGAGADAGATAATGAGKTENNKSNGSNGSNGSNESEIQKVINEEMEAIKEGLENLENKDYVDRLLPFLEKEFEYYEIFINNDDKGINNSELEKFFSNIDNFLKRYKILYVGYIAYNDKEKNEKKEILDEKNNKFEKKQKEIKVIEKKLKDLKKELESTQDKIDLLNKKADEKGLDPEEIQDIPQDATQDATQDADQPKKIVQGGSRGSRIAVIKSSRRGCKQKFISIRGGGEGEQGGDGGDGGQGGEGQGGDGGQGGQGGEGQGGDGGEGQGGKEDGGDGKKEDEEDEEAKEKEKEERENEKKKVRKRERTY